MVLNFKKASKIIFLYLNNIFWKVLLIGRPKIFVISFQRTGTTSTGKFFNAHNFRVAKYSLSTKNNWTLNWVNGDYEKIFNSLDFNSHQVFEDNPWWCGDFYKILFHRFPNSKFVLVERDPDKWFDSMVSHSNGKTLGNTYLHCKIYRREEDYYNLNNNSKYMYSGEIDNLLNINENYREHYKKIYQLRNREIIEFFDQFGKERLVCTKLEDQNKWNTIGDFFGIKVKEGYTIHANRSNK